MEAEIAPDKTIFGFWVFLMTDCILFAMLFATYLVLHQGTFGGPTSQEIFRLPIVLIETLLLLTSSFTSGLAMLRIQSGNKKSLILWFAVTFLLGAAFLAIEIADFAYLVHVGSGWQRSAFLSSFFTLVGTHGIHVAFGLLWMLILVTPTLRGTVTQTSLMRLTCLRFYWHFLDVVWIFIFTLVYLLGAR